MGEWSLCGDHVNSFCVGIYSHDEWNIPTKKQFTWSPHSDHHENVLVFMP